VKKCPKCAEDIQEAATVCKHCKTDLSAEDNTRRGAKVLGVFFLLMIGGCWWIMQPDNSPEALAEREMDNARVATAVLCERDVTNRLMSPGTADYPFGHVSTVTKTQEGHYQLESYVDSQNRMGALVRTRFVCVVSGAGRDVSGYRIQRVTLMD
jgi:hypothetical protein